MARGLCSTLSPDDAHRILSRTVFLSVLKSMDRYQLEKHYLDKVKVIFSEAKKSVFGKISIRVPGAGLYHLTCPPIVYQVILFSLSLCLPVLPVIFVQSI